MATPLNAYYGITVALTTGAQNLLKLLQAVDSSLNGLSQNVAGLALQADTGNSSNNVLVGDSNVASGRYAYALVAGAQRVYDKGVANDIPLGSIWVMGSGGTPGLHVEIFL